MRDSGINRKAVHSFQLLWHVEAAHLLAREGIGRVSVGEPRIGHFHDEDVLEGDHVHDAEYPVPDARQPLGVDVVEVVDADWDMPQASQMTFGKSTGTR